MRRRHGSIRQRAARGAHVLAHVGNLAGRRDGAGNGRMRDDELEEELRPVGGADLRGPRGEPVTLDRLNERSPPEGTVADDGDPTLLRQWENALLDLAVEDVVARL